MVFDNLFLRFTLLKEMRALDCYLQRRSFVPEILKHKFMNRTIDKIKKGTLVFFLSSFPMETSLELI